MRIGVDFDGVVCDTIAAMITYAADTHGLELTPSDCIAANGPAGLDVATFVRLVEDTHRTEYALRMQPVDGAIDALRQMARDHELFIVTARREAAFAYAQRWVSQFGIASLIREFVSTAGTTKSAVCTALALDMLIDDLPHHLDGLPVGVTPVLWGTAYNTGAPIVAPMVRAEDWRHVVALVERAP